MNLLKSIFGSSATHSSLNASGAKALIDGDHPPYILDVRQPVEFKSGHLHNAHLIPLDQLSARMKELPEDREILCVCQSGSRSSSAARLLSGAGYQVINLSGGMLGWQRAGYPIKRGN